MKIITGLGNPGLNYQFNRHNIGFMILDYHALKRKMSFKKDNDCLITKRKDFILAKPQTYMNLSGEALLKLPVKPDDDLLVICDDIYLPFGEVRLRMSGGDGGHNGLKSIIYALDTDNFCRMRIGVGAPTEKYRLSDHVLEDFSLEEQEKFPILFDFTSKLIDCFIFNGSQSMLNYNSKNKKSYSVEMLQNQCPKEEHKK